MSRELADSDGRDQTRFHCVLFLPKVFTVVFTYPLIRNNLFRLNLFEYVFFF